MATNYKFASPQVSADVPGETLPLIGRVVVSQSGGYEILNLSYDIFPRLKSISKELKKMNFYLSNMNDFQVNDSDVEVD